MSRVRRLYPLAILLLLLGLGIGLLLHFRLGAGDVYPKYSSLRADPLGLRLLHDSLESIPGLQVSRWHQDLSKLGPGGERTLVLAGMSGWRWGSLELKQLNALDAAVRQGDRLVLCFSSPVIGGADHRWPYDAELMRKRREEQERFEREMKKRLGQKDAPEEKKEGGDGESKGDDPKDAGDAEGADKPREITSQREWTFYGTDASVEQVRRLWGLDLRARWFVPKGEAGEPVGLPTHRRPPIESVVPAVLHPNLKDPSLPQSLAWGGSVYCRFEQGAPWRVLYERSGLPVLAEMQHGKGSIVIATDTRFLSNEGLDESPNAPLLNWLLGNPLEVVFEESHLGVVTERGIASLARHYGLLPAMCLLILAGLLHAWRLAARFVPPPSEPQSLALEFNPTAGLESLLRRAVPQSGVFGACLREWRRTAKPGDVSKLSALGEQGCLEAYNHAVQALKKRKL